MKRSYIRAGEFFDKECGITAIRVHSECVIDICLNSSSNTVLEEDVFIIAGFLHDIVRKQSSDKHHILAIDYLKKFLKEYPVYEKFFDEIRDCIIHHRRFENPQTMYAKIFQNAILLVPYTKKWREFEKRRMMK